MPAVQLCVVDFILMSSLLCTMCVHKQTNNHGKYCWRQICEY